jgi:hypothetical protein
LNIVLHAFDGISERAIGFHDFAEAEFIAGVLIVGMVAQSKMAKYAFYRFRVGVRADLQDFVIVGEHLNAAAFAKGLGKAVLAGEQRAIHRRLHKPYKKRVRMPSMLDPHVEEIDRSLAAEPRLTALAILGHLVARCPGRFGPPQHTIVQRLLKAYGGMQPAG